LIQYIDFTSSGPDDDVAIGQILNALGMAGTISIEPLARQEQTQVKSQDQNAPISNESTGPQVKIEKNNVIPYKKILIGIFFAIMIIAGLFIYTTINSSNNNLENENLLVSNYHDMYLNERNLFGASIALDDSVKEALYDLPTGNFIAPNGGINPTYGNENNAAISSTNESMSVGTRVDLTGQSFEITPANDLTSRAQDIPHNNPGQNLAKWKWWVIPREKGSHTLFIDAYTEDEKGHRTSINSTIREIGVIVTSAPAANVNETKTTTVPTYNNDIIQYDIITSTEKKTTPGFEGILAITGLMVVAYLVLGRKP
jgi:hypothetical protein